MNAYRVSPAAQTDMDEIWDYIAADNVKAAHRLIKRLVRQFAVLAERPQIAAVCEDLPGELRSFTVGNYVIYYQIVGQRIEIARVLHGARDAQGILGSHGNGDDAA